MSPLGQWTKFFLLPLWSLVSGLTEAASRVGALGAGRNGAPPNQGGIKLFWETTGMCKWHMTRN